MSRLPLVLLTLALAPSVAARSGGPAARADDALPVKRGLWLLPRHDPGNSGRSDMTGEFKKPPREVWSYGSTKRDYGFLRPVTAGGNPAYLLGAGAGLEVVLATGQTVWQQPGLGRGTIVDVLNCPAFPEPASSEGSQAALVTLGNNSFALIEIATGRTLWSWTTPAGSMLGGYKLWKGADSARLVVFPQNTVEGFCFEIAGVGSQPRLVWHQQYAGRYWANYGPSVVLADMTKSGKPDILLAGKPAYMAVLDIDTGAVKFDLAYPVAGEAHVGRPYGLLQAKDLDGDGYPEAAMISCQVEEYAAILHNEQGKGLRLAWSRFIEHDLPDDHYELRPNITSFADLAGDGKLAFVMGLYNIENDHRWHTVVFDPLAGWNKRLADLPDRYFWGCYDLDGDGRPEIVTSTEKERRFGKATKIQAVEGRTFQDIATIEDAALVTAAPPLPADTAFLAIRHTPLFATLPGAANGSEAKESNAKGLLVRRETGEEALWRLEQGRSVFESFNATPLARLAFLSKASDTIERSQLTVPGLVGPSSPAASNPLVAAVDGRPELIFALADGTILGGTPDLARSGQFQSFWQARGTMPAAWIGRRGDRTVAALDPEKDAVLLYRSEARDRAETAAASGLEQPNMEITLPHPPLRLGASGTADALLPFGEDAMRLYVALQTGTHTMASALYDAAGKQLWLDEKEGPYPRRAAAADLEGQGRITLIVDNHGKHMLYGEGGRKRLIAHGWNSTVPGRGDGAKYALPMIGPYGPGGQMRIVMSPGLEVLEILDPAGARLAKAPYGSIYEREWCSSAAARRSDGSWDIGMATSEGVFHCADLATGQDRWTLPLGVKASYPIHVASADLTGAGRDNFLIGLSNGELVALDEQNGRGTVFWKTRFPAAIQDVILGDLDRDGRIEIIVQTDDGRIRVLKPD